MTCPSTLTSGVQPRAVRRRFEPCRGMPRSSHPPSPGGQRRSPCHALLAPRPARSTRPAYPPASPPPRPPPPRLANHPWPAGIDDTPRSSAPARPKAPTALRSSDSFLLAQAMRGHPPADRPSHRAKPQPSHPVSQDRKIIAFLPARRKIDRLRYFLRARRHFHADGFAIGIVPNRHHHLRRWRFPRRDSKNCNIISHRRCRELNQARIVKPQPAIADDHDRPAAVGKPATHRFLQKRLRIDRRWR